MSVLVVFILWLLSHCNFVPTWSFRLDTYSIVLVEWLDCMRFAFTLLIFYWAIFKPLKSFRTHIPFEKKLTMEQLISKIRFFFYIYFSLLVFDNRFVFIHYTADSFRYDCIQFSVPINRKYISGQIIRTHKIDCGLCKWEHWRELSQVISAKRLIFTSRLCDSSKTIMGNDKNVRSLAKDYMQEIKINRETMKFTHKSNVKQIFAFRFVNGHKHKQKHTHRYNVK